MIAINVMRIIYRGFLLLSTVSRVVCLSHTLGCLSVPLSPGKNASCLVFVCPKKPLLFLNVS
jgi:hypothetical protein